MSVVCNSNDDPEPLDRWTESAGREVVSGEITTPVITDPGLDVGLAWAASYVNFPLDEFEWWEFRTAQDRKRRDPMLPKLWFELRHLEDGTLEIFMSPVSGPYTTNYAVAHVVPRGDEMVATLRNYYDSDASWPRQHPIVGAELRLSSTSWTAGTELSVFLEITEYGHARMCGEARFVVPPRGGRTEVDAPEEHAR
jgi:hypothetical protein